MYVCVWGGGVDGGGECEAGVIPVQINTKNGAIQTN